MKIELPPLPNWCDARSPAAETLREYARAAVALNAPKWHKTKDEPPPDEDREVLSMDISGFREVNYASDVRSNQEIYTFWMPLPTGPEES